MKKWIAAGAVAFGAACAVRVGGPAPVEYRALSMAAAPDESPAEVAARIRGAMPDFVLLSATRDSAWFRALADSTGLVLSGPSTTSASGLAFLTRNIEPLGDTSIVIDADGGGRIHMHDALYEVDERLLDLMLVRVDPVTDVGAVVRALLAYEATDVMPTATIVLGVETADPAAADSIVVRMRAAFQSAIDCAGDNGMERPGVRLLYRPPARIRCREAQVLDGHVRPVLVTLVLGQF